MKKSISSDLDVVFVHLGQANPRHIAPNLKLIAANYPNYRIHLILSERTDFYLEDSDDISIFRYKAKPEIDYLLTKIFKNTSFRSGFWRYSFERLFALVSFHQAYPHAKIIHLESDIFLFPNCPLNRFLDLPTMSWLNVDEEKDVASIIYMPNLEQTMKFEKRLITYLEKELESTDMFALRYIRNEYLGEYHLLPSISMDFPKLQNSNLENINDYKRLEEMSRFNDLFSGVFDPAPYGMWLTGIDPRNNYGKTNLFDTSTILNAKFFIDPSQYRFNYDRSEGLTLNSENQKLRIWNLHVHSKSLDIFSNIWETEIERLVSLSHNGAVRKEFNFRIFLSLIRSNVSERTLLPYIYYSPTGRIFRKVHHLFRRIAKRFL
jgi:hypothetical protein